MARKKSIKVQDLLNLMEDVQPVVVTFYAYGIHYAESIDSGKTAWELKENMNYDCLQAEVCQITTFKDMVRIHASLTK